MTGNKNLSEEQLRNKILKYKTKYLQLKQSIMTGGFDDEERLEQEDLNKSKELVIQNLQSGGIDLSFLERLKKEYEKKTIGELIQIKNDLLSKKDTKLSDDVRNELLNIAITFLKNKQSGGSDFIQSLLSTN